jgi:hypothetical protein
VSTSPVLFGWTEAGSCYHRVEDVTVNVRGRRTITFLCGGFVVAKGHVAAGVRSLPSSVRNRKACRSCTEVARRRGEW